jgi:outer membrane lipopolysaccharide assembly protein LptE/RlpB
MRTLLPTLALCALASCGYHVSGHGDLMPKSVKTIAVMPFGNVTIRYKLARTLPEDIARELISRTNYKIVSDPNQADAVLTGTLINFFAGTSISTAGRNTAVEATVNLVVTLTDRKTGKVLFSRKGQEYREHYEVAVDPAAYFDESGTAMMRLSKDVARSVVAGILENF